VGFSKFPATNEKPPTVGLHPEIDRNETLIVGVWKGKKKLYTYTHKHMQTHPLTCSLTNSREKVKKRESERKGAIERERESEEFYADMERKDTLILGSLKGKIIQTNSERARRKVGQQERYGEREKEEKSKEF